MPGRHCQKCVRRKVRKRYRKKHISLCVHVGTVPLQARPVDGQFKYLYRAMRRDLEDVLPLGHRTEMDRDSHIHKMLVLIAVWKGSRTKSPFIHASKDPFLANMWHDFACRSRGERVGNQLVVCINVEYLR